MYIFSEYSMATSNLPVLFSYIWILIKTFILESKLWLLNSNPEFVNGAYRQFFKTDKKENYLKLHKNPSNCAADI